ncbi:MAG TPA: hypothetical protein VEL69_08380 [Ktedonobacteraceae bacterium]|nr:hypothetical protein [Ktedonobacteraceae bacterium]
MPKQTETVKSKWMTAKEAAERLTERSGHKVSDAYVRRMGLAGRITVEKVDERTKLYLRSDVERITVAPRGDGSVRRAARAKRTPAAQQEQGKEKAVA